MADFLIQATLSNLMVSTILALIAWVVQRRFRTASLSNLLWAIVLVKMVTPPLFSLPVVEVPSVSSSIVQPTGWSSELPTAYTTDPISGAADLVLPKPTESATSHTTSQATSDRFWSRSSRLAIFAWIAVSAILFFVSAFRIVRFHCLLKANSRVQQKLTSGLCSDVARQLGLRRCPDVFVTSANIAPFVWWMAGRSIIVVSEQSIQQLNDCDLRFVITHEMAHIKRRDHWFRWLEWLTLVGLWWNPVMWWARTHLRLSEEMACDEMVLETTHSEVHQYANSLLTMAELLTSSAIRPPVVASAINSGGKLEKRLKMMITEKTWQVPAALRLGIVAIAFCILPLGLVYAQDYEAIKKRLGKAVQAGELSRAQAGVMLEALKSSDKGDESKGALRERYMQAVERAKAAVESGQATEEQVEEKLKSLRQRMFGEKQPQTREGQDSEMDAMKRRYMAAAEAIEKAVKEGEVSKEDAQKRLIGMRKSMFGNGGRKGAKQDNDPDIAGKRRRYEEGAKQIKAAVEAGRITEEDAEKRLNEMRAKIFRGVEMKDRDNDKDMGALKRRYEEGAKKIRAAVEAGRTTKEDAEKRLIEMRKSLFGDVQQDPDVDKEMEAKKRRYMAFANEIEAAIAAGKLSKEDAKKKLIELRKKMFSDDN